jgi:hypothetical protein
MPYAFHPTETEKEPLFALLGIVGKQQHVS